MTKPEAKCAFPGCDQPDWDSRHVCVVEPPVCSRLDCHPFTACVGDCSGKKGMPCLCECHAPARVPEEGKCPSGCGARVVLKGTIVYEAEGLPLHSCPPFFAPARVSEAKPHDIHNEACGCWDHPTITVPRSAVSPQSGEPAEARCSGRFSDAFDCPVHDPRKNATPPSPHGGEEVVMHRWPYEGWSECRGHDGNGEADGKSLEHAVATITRRKT